jgi:hypothetical protein
VRQGGDFDFLTPDVEIDIPEQARSLLEMF